MPNVKLDFNPPLASIGEAFNRVNLDKTLRQTAEAIAFSIESYAKQVTPVDTGRLRSSIRVSSLLGNGIKLNVQPNTTYAYWVHQGTRYMKGRPFMGWGVEFTGRHFTTGEVGRRLSDDLRKQLSQVIKPV